jgi:hypothetical protein
MKGRSIVYEKSVKNEKESIFSSIFQINSFKNDKLLSFDQSNDDSSNL